MFTRGSALRQATRRDHPAFLESLATALLQELIHQRFARRDEPADHFLRFPHGLLAGLQREAIVPKLHQ